MNGTPIIWTLKANLKSTLAFGVPLEDIELDENEGDDDQPGAGVDELTASYSKSSHSWVVNGSSMFRPGR